MQLTKHHGLGNDFLVLLDSHLDDAIRFDADLARALCDRRRGIGADGLIRVGPSTVEADVTMGLRNADGSRAEMSGNGIRCLGQAVARARGCDTIDLAVATDAGVRRLHVRPGPDPVTAAVDVAMGPARPGPVLSGLPGLVEVTKVATVDMGNPHLVLLVDDPVSFDLAALGPACQDHFDQGINVELVAPVRGGTDILELLVWE
ncbi:MAG TPA: diaminopimelate epimerase, partial [Acidimicrobiales bacterium]|nr:diaminopimelate epimerase [Acidimicrobiales bacterium]